ncbi:hypothetical protein F4861DRAFT_231114 [Xylaria intraflava]|nr:hypothetical protein F4861DRAFT_231114 [Xylaria intraflava]
MSTQLSLLKSNAAITPPTSTKPYYEVTVTSPASRCKVTIAATKALPDPIYRHVRPPPEASEYVSLHHTWYCTCNPRAKSAQYLFDLWQRIHRALRYESGDQAAYAFYPEFKSEIGEALAHASLAASLVVGRRVPERYNNLVQTHGTWFTQLGLA